MRRTSKQYLLPIKRDVGPLIRERAGVVLGAGRRTRRAGVILGHERADGLLGLVWVWLLRVVSGRPGGQLATVVGGGGLWCFVTVRLTHVTFRRPAARLR